MKKTTTEEAADAEPPVTPQQREFLEKVYGYTEVPTVWELSQLAAMLGGKIPEAHSPQAKDEVHRRMELASQIWDAAALKRQEIRKRLGETIAHFDARYVFYGPLKVGTHYMPRIRWQAENGIIPFKLFLEQVVGMAREEDRLLWWRTYLTARFRRDQHRDRWGSNITAKQRKHRDWCEADEFPIDERLVSEAIARQREEGFREGLITSDHLEAFRKWRLEMKSPKQRADSPLPVEEAVKKGLEAEQNFRS